MASRFFSTILLLALCCLNSTAAVSVPSHLSDAGPAVHHQTVAIYFFQPEVRLRKLHLVRPDLIPYPIDIEVDC
jgi:hypothetical protein